MAIGFKYAGFQYLSIPVSLISILGTATAFYLGFKNNSSYARLWEARKIWGGIVNTSRTWGMKVQEMVNNQYSSTPIKPEEIREQKKILIYNIKFVKLY